MAAGTRSLGVLMLVGVGVAAPSMPARAACLAQGDETATIAAVEPRLDLRLADGRLLRLVGIDPVSATPDGAALAESARAQLAAMAGHAVSVHLLGGKPDRWGRLAAFVFPTGGTPPDPAGGLATMAIAAGLALYRPEPPAHGCRDAFLEAEAKARAARLGLWRDPSYAVLAPGDRSAFAERSATFVVAQGRLTAVDAGPYRTKLKFGTRDGDGRGALAATILPRIVKSFREQGVNVQSLIGRTLRVRGLLDVRFGPEIELTGPDAMEVLPAEVVPTVPPVAAGNG